MLGQKTNSVERMKFIESNEGMYETIRQTITERGAKANGPCPCPDCDGILREKEIKYTNTDSEQWTIVKIPVLSCKCGFQVRMVGGE